MHAIMPRLAAVYCFACTYYCYFTVLANMYTRIALATNTFVASAQKKTVAHIRNIQQAAW